MSEFPWNFPHGEGIASVRCLSSSNGLQFGIKCRNPDGTEHFPSLGLSGAGTGGRNDLARLSVVDLHS